MKKICTDFYNRIKKADVFSKKVFTVLYSSAFVCIMIITVAQIGLKTDSARRFFTDIDTYEGAYFEATAQVEDPEHTIMLNVESDDDLEGAEIWMNGKSYSALTLGNNEVKITEPAVIEIYAPESKVNVKLTDMSNGVIMYTADNEIIVDNGLKIFGRFGIK